MTTGTTVGFVLTVVALATFLAVSWRQLVRIRRTLRDEVAADGYDAPGDGGG